MAVCIISFHHHCTHDTASLCAIMCSRACLPVCLLHVYTAVRLLCPSSRPSFMPRHVPILPSPTPPSYFRPLDQDGRSRLLSVPFSPVPSAGSGGRRAGVLYASVSLKKSQTPQARCHVRGRKGQARG